MYSEIIKPRFCETDALGHINNTVISEWFEGARDPIFRQFTPNLNLDNWPLILARFSIDFHAELHYGKDIEIRTYISRLGSSSFDVLQEAWQNKTKCASGTTVMVHFDYRLKKAKPINDEVRFQLEQHMTTPVLEAENF